MKKILKKILTISLIFIMILSAVPVQARMPEYFGGKKTVTLYTGKTIKNNLTKNFFKSSFIGFFRGADGKLTFINKEAYRVIPYSKFAKKKVKVTFNLKKGWHVIKQGVSYIEKSWYKSQDVDNGSIIPINSRDFVICADVVNEKTGQQERILLLLK